MSLLGFGSLPAASWRGQRGRQVPGGYTGAGSALQNLVNANQRAAAERFYSPARTLEVVASARPPLGTPVSAMNTMHFAGLGATSPGLGLVNSAFCDEFELAIETLGLALARATQSTANIEMARKVYETETSANIFGRTKVWLGNCEGQTARIAQLIDLVNRDLGASAVPVPPSVREQGNDADIAAGNKPPPEMDPTVKFAIVGGIVVAGIIGVAVITGQVAPLLRTVKKAF